MRKVEFEVEMPTTLSIELSGLVGKKQARKFSHFPKYKLFKKICTYFWSPGYSDRFALIFNSFWCRFLFLIDFQRTKNGIRHPKPRVYFYNLSLFLTNILHFIVCCTEFFWLSRRLCNNIFRLEVILVQIKKSANVSMKVNKNELQAFRSAF